MGHFSNGTEGMIYEEHYCMRCVHYHDRHSCPVWDMHKLYQGEEKYQPLLDEMIPRLDKAPWNGECMFFVSRAKDAEVRENEACDHTIGPGGASAWRPGIDDRYEVCSKCGKSRKTERVARGIPNMLAGRPMTLRIPSKEAP